MKTTFQLFKIAFAFSIVLVLLGATFKIMHLGFSEPLLIVGLLLSLIYIIIIVYEVNNSRTLDKSEKIMWTVGFIFMATITAIIYLLVGRKKAMSAST